MRAPPHVHLILTRHETVSTDAQLSRVSAPALPARLRDQTNRGRECQDLPATRSWWSFRVEVRGAAVRTGTAVPASVFSDPCCMQVDVESLLW